MYLKSSFILISLFVFIGCENFMNKSDEISDDQLMQDIIDAEKIDIYITDLPSFSQTVIEEDYNNYIEIEAQMASGLGYQVSMDSKEYKPGDHNEIYFNWKGKKLKPKLDRGDKNGFICFELVLPVTFIMPDASSITVDEENGYMSIKDWYVNNPDSNVKPTLQYPLNIIYRDAETQIINNNEEMKNAKVNCRKWDANKNKWNCFRLVYPTTFIMPDGSTMLMEDTHDWTEIKSWYESNPETQEKPTLEYPVEIIYRDSSTKTINNKDEMRNAKEDCIN